MHIAVLNQHHQNPDCPATCRHYTFLEELAKRHRVSLVASDGWRRMRLTKNYPWVPKGVELHECKVAYANKMGIALRLKSFAGFAASAFKQAMQLQKPDVIWAVSTPLTTPWVAARVARLRGVPWVFEVQDLWPSFPIAMGAVKGSWIKQRLYRMEKKLYHSASHIITLSPDMTEYVVSLGISRSKITTNFNGTDLDLVAATHPEEVEAMRRRHALVGKHVVLYAGTYGRANDIPTLLAVVEKLSEHPHIHFVFTGSGYYEPQLQQLSQRVPNLLLLPPQPRTGIFKLFKLADLSVVSFNNLPVLDTNSPAKLYDSLACGTPVLVTNTGWTKAFVAQHACGWYTPAEQPDKMCLAIQEILQEQHALKAAGIRGAAIATQLFDRQQLVKQVEDVLLSAAR
ncbi:glycosyltransferase family 4 protein [Pontibacter sp. E15-1]|uniref:glycosyltransferase family 4 protein n=1 Tax=Pontibacter sp. E15-1 TaxID=2919918 RepID=UPI001F4F4916|nr:glycosyltransferase family 4 protein [Pontibacter sp. E15-1]MCJ8164797.1 glycosyltransferase family 4 protein [Pontibacter sp. E15-1]